MQTDIFTELSIVIVIGALISLGMRLIKQPLIIGYIITGLVVGPSLLNVITDQETIEVFSSLGVALLLFIIGLGLNPSVVREVGKVASITGIAQVMITSFTGFIVSRAFGYTKTESILVGIALAFSSTIIVLKLLSDKKEHTRLFGKIAIGILLIQDIVAAMVLLLVVARTEGGDFSPVTMITLGFRGLLILTPLFILGNYVLPKFGKLIAGSQEFLFLFAIGWGFGAATLFEHYGFSIEIGALFAGVALSNLPYSQEIASRLRPLRDFFVVVFFIALGTKLSLNNLTDTWPLVIIFTGIVIVIKPLVTMIIMGILGYTKNTGFKTSSSLAQISEFSLVLIIMGNQQGIIRPEIVNIITIVALITIATSSYAITYGNSIYNLLERNLSLFERRKTKPEHNQHNRFEMLLVGYNKGGQEFIKVMGQMKKKFVVVDYDPEIIDLLSNRNIEYIYGDVTDMELLNELNIPKTKLVVSTIGDHDTNMFLARYLERTNPHAVYICTAETAQQASDLYNAGVSYVMMPHYIGSEKIGSFIKRNGFDKTEFKNFREKHLQYLQTHYVNT